MASWQKNTYQSDDLAQTRLLHHSHFFSCPGYFMSNKFSILALKRFWTRVLDLNVLESVYYSIISSIIWDENTQLWSYSCSPITLSEHAHTMHGFVSISLDGQRSRMYSFRHSFNLFTKMCNACNNFILEHVKSLTNGVWKADSEMEQARTRCSTFTCIYM